MILAPMRDISKFGDKRASAGNKKYNLLTRYLQLNPLALQTWTMFGDDTIVAQQQHIFQMHGAPRQPQQQMFAGVCA